MIQITGLNYSIKKESFLSSLRKQTKKLATSDFLGLSDFLHENSKLKHDLWFLYD